MIETDETIIGKNEKKNKCSAFAYTFLYAYVIIFSDFKKYHFHQVLSGVTTYPKTGFGDLHS